MSSTLVCPREHREDVTADFNEDEYLALQSVIYRVATAVRQAVQCDRVYVLSLGSQQGNRHVHWHVAPLPPGVPVEEQQLAALECERGILSVSWEEMERLARRIRGRLLG